MVEAKTPLDGWLLSLKEIIENGDVVVQKGNRKFREISNYNLTISKEHSKINKVLGIMQNSDHWIYPSKEEIREIILSNTPNPGLAYTFGRRITKYGPQKINQLDDFVIPLLNRNKFSKRAVITLWEPEFDSKPVKKDTPSFVIMNFIIRDNKLHITAVTRSMDFFFGWPSHYYQLVTLQEYVLRRIITNNELIEAGSISTFCFSSLVFEENIDYITKNILLKRKL